MATIGSLGIIGVLLALAVWAVVSGRFTTSVPTLSPPTTTTATPGSGHPSTFTSGVPSITTTVQAPSNSVIVP